VPNKSIANPSKLMRFLLIVVLSRFC
jgi:hypothetical protein